MGNRSCGRPVTATIRSASCYTQSNRTRWALLPGGRPQPTSPLAFSSLRPENKYSEARSEEDAPMKATRLSLTALLLVGASALATSAFAQAPAAPAAGAPAAAPAAPAAPAIT